MRHVVVIGTGPRARRFVDEVEAGTAGELAIVAFVDESPVAHSPGLCAQVHELGEFRTLVKERPVDEVVVAWPRSRLGLLGPIAAECALVGVPLCVLSDLFTDELPALRPVRYGSLPALRFADVDPPEGRLRVKRCLDVCLGSLLLAGLAPLLLLAMLAIRSTSRGPALHRQVRLGRYGHPFVMWKLRSMVADAERLRGPLLARNEVQGPVFKILDDPRITPVGRFLRRWSIDEIPQLWNVIRGDMSLVGPRPPLPEEADHYAPRHRRRISMRPGLTCLWQIQGRSLIPFDEWMELDLHYVDHWSLGLDLAILLRTPLAVLRRDGAA